MEAPALPPRYEHRAPLGAGGSARIERVWDRERGCELALKILTPPAGTDRAAADAAFRREFWALATFRHPNLVQAHDFDQLPDGAPCFTLELVPGRSLAALDGPRPEDEVRAWLPGLLGALAALHDRGFVHGDLKPENVRLASDGRAVLMDLGLLAREGAWDGELGGTLACLAPEAIAHAARDRRSDLYALGCLLYQVLAGQPPFDAADPSALLRAHMEAVPVALRRVAPAVSVAMEALVGRLLAKRPADRPADVDEVRAALGLPREAAGAAGLLEGPLVGRDELVAELEARALAAVPGALWLTGAAGAGKSRLLRHVRVRAQLAGRPVVALRGAGADAPPYQAVHALVRTLVLRGEGPAAVLAESFLRAGGPSAASALDAPREKLRAHAALAELALAVWPEAVWLIDDADELDPASRELLAHLRAAGAARPWCWLTTAERAPEGGADEVLALSPLAAEALPALAADALGGAAPPELGGPLAELSEGNPGRARALLGHWLRGGALRRDEGGWRFVPAAADLPAGWDLRGEGDGAVAVTVTGGERLLALAGLLGPRGALADLAVLWAEAGDGAEFGTTLWALAGRAALRLEGEAYAFDHAGRALACAARVPAAERARLHARAFALLATRAEAAGGPRAQLPLETHLAIARHGIAGGAGEAAWPWVLAAARRALLVSQIDAAGALLTAAEALPPADEGLADDLALVRAHVHRARGEVDAALALFDEARLARLAERGDPELPNHLTTRGVLLQLAGRYADALARYREAEALAAGSGAEAARVRALLFAGRLAYFMGDPAATERHFACALAAAEAPGALRHRGWAMSLYGHWLATRGGAEAARGLAMLREAVALNRAQRDPYTTHEALNNLGDALLAEGRPAEAEAAFAECLAIADGHGLGNETIVARVNLALAALGRGRPRHARTHARAALAGALAQGRRYPESLARAALGAAEVLAGDAASGLAELARARALADELGNRYLALGALTAQAEAALTLGDWPRCAAALAEAEALAEASGDRTHAARLATCRLALSVLGGDGPDEAARALVLLPPQGRAPELDAGLVLTTAAAQPEWLFWRALASAPDADLDAVEAAAVTLDLGRLRAEIALARVHAGPLDEAALAAALADAREAGLALHEAALAAALAARRSDRAELRREAARRLREITAPLDGTLRAALAAHPWWAALTQAAEAGEEEPLVRFAGLVAELARAGDPDAMLERALLAAVDLAEAERGFLVLYDGLAVTACRRVGRDEPGFEDFSLGLAHRVLFFAEPCFIEDVTADAELAGRDSVRRLGVRAVAAVPLRLDGAVAGVLITDARRPRSRPWGAERALLSALADHVAVALGGLRRAEAARAERDAVAAAHRLALSAMAAPSPEAARALVLAEACRCVGAERAWLYGEGGEHLVASHGADAARAPQLAAGLAAWALAQGEPVALPFEEAGARGAVWAVPLPDEHVLLLVREAGGPPGAAESARLVPLADVLAATLATARR